jgi:hypothetical protein
LIQFLICEYDRHGTPRKHPDWVIGVVPSLKVIVLWWICIRTGTRLRKNNKDTGNDKQNHFTAIYIYIDKSISIAVSRFRFYDYWCFTSVIDIVN